MPSDGSYMRITLKNNRALLKNKGYFKLKKEFIEGAKHMSIDLKKATPEQLEQIRDRMILRNKRLVRRKIVALFLAVLITVFLFYELKEGIALMMTS